MKLKKMITVSAAALMLAGVGASTTNAVPHANASRVSVRVNHLNGKRTMLEKQIRSDQHQIKQINRKMARLGHKRVRSHKHSKKATKRRKAPKKTLKSNKQQQLLSAAKKNRIHTHLNMNGQLYNVTINGLGQIVNRPQSTGMSVKKYEHKRQYKKAMKAYAKDYQKLQGLVAKKDQAGAQKLQSSRKFMNDLSAYQKNAVFTLKQK